MIIGCLPEKKAATRMFKKPINGQTKNAQKKTGALYGELEWAAVQLISARNIKY